MAKPRTKKRTHMRVDHSAKGSSATRSPKSMVIRRGAGEVGSSISQLVKDVRAMMEPDTASRLKERKSNKLKDYTSMAGPLGVTHLLLFSRSNSGNTNLRIALTPRGPTLHFRVDKYSLCRDVTKAQKHPRGGGKEYLSPPLLVMNNFNAPATSQPSLDPRQAQLESLSTTIFQSLFPSISPQTTALSSIRRIMLLNRETNADSTYILNLRHYAITTKRTGISKRIRRLHPGEQRARERKGTAIPNLSRLDDVADYLLDPAAGGFTSASETEPETDAEVEVLQTSARKVLSKREMYKLRNGDASKPKTPSDRRNAVEKRAVKLIELGPRMRLRLVKVEEGICEGRIMWHDFVTKSPAEEKELDQKWDKRRKEKDERRREQKENVERKRQVRVNTARNANGNVAEDGRDEAGEEWDSEDSDEDIEDVDEDEDDDMGK